MDIVLNKINIDLCLHRADIVVEEGRHYAYKGNIFLKYIVADFAVNKVPALMDFVIMYFHLCIYGA